MSKQGPLVREQGDYSARLWLRDSMYPLGMIRS